MSSNGPRYQARAEAHGHACCYEACVLDTVELDGYGHHQLMCECFTIEEAKLIALALNRHQTQENGGEA